MAHIMWHISTICKNVYQVCGKYREYIGNIGQYMANIGGGALETPGRKLGQFISREQPIITSPRMKLL